MWKESRRLCFLVPAILVFSLMGGPLWPAAAQDPDFDGAGSAETVPESAAEAARTWSGVTVVTKDGWTFPDVTIQWVPGGEVARLRVVGKDGVYKDWDTFQIVVIRNAMDVDITAEVAAAKPEFTDQAPVEHRESPLNEIGTPVPKDPTHKSLGDLAFKYLFDVSYGFCASYGWPIGGAWYEGINGGPGVLGNIRLRTHKRNYVNILFQYRKLGVEDFYLQDPIDDSVHRAESEYNQKSVFLLVGAYGRPARAGWGNFYLEAGFGWTSHSITVTVNQQSASESLGKVGSMVRFGYIAPAGGGARIEFGLSFQTKDAVIFHRDEAGGTILAGHVGFMFF